ncbi:tetratricopeptide repeat protein [Phycisphaeraceae bacterium D3-23]
MLLPYLGLTSWNPGQRNTRAFAGGVVVTAAILLGAPGCGGGSSSSDSFEQGVKLQEEGKWGEAIAAYDAVLAKDAEHAGALFNRGVSRLESDDAQGAAKDFAAVLAIAPDDLDARLWRGSARLASGDTAEAVKDFDAVIEASPLAPEAYALRAQAHIDTDAFDNALADCDAAVRLNPDEADYYELRAAVFDAMDEPEAAEVERSLAAVTRQILADPEDASARALRGTAFLVLDEPELALPDLAFAIERLPANADLRLTRGQCYASLNLPAEALEDLSAVIAMDDADPATVGQARLSRAAVYESRGAYADAIAEYELLREIDGMTGISATVRLARLRAGCPEVALRRPSEAVALATHALERFDAAVALAADAEGEHAPETGDEPSDAGANPEDRWFYLDTLAAAHYADGQQGEAIRYQGQAVEASPEELRPVIVDRHEAYQESANLLDQR